VGLAGYIHLSAAFFFATHAVIYGALVLRRRRLGASWRPEDRFAGLSGTNPLFAMLAGALLTVAFHAVLIPQILDTMSAVSGASVDGSQTAESTGTPAKWTNPLWMVFEVLRSFSSFGPLLLVAAPIAGTLMVVGARSLAKKNAVFVAIYVVYVPLTLALLLAAGFRLWPRYFLVEISFGFIAICRGIVVVSDYLETHTKVRTWLKLGQLRFSTVACGLALVASLVLLPKNYLYPKQDFEGAMRYVEQAMGSGDVVATLGLASAPYLEYYKPEWLILETPQQLDELRSKHEATWVIYSFSAHTRGHYPEIVDMLKSQFEEMREFPGTLGDGEVVVWRARP